MSSLEGGPPFRDGGVIMRAKIFQGTDPISIDLRINEWLEDTGALVRNSTSAAAQTEVVVIERVSGRRIAQQATALTITIFYDDGPAGPRDGLASRRDS